MDIQITSKYWINTEDKLNYTLYEKRIVEDDESKNKGKTYETGHKYFTSFENAIAKALEFTVMEAKISELKEVQNAVKDAKNEIKSYVQKLVKNSELILNQQA